MFFVKILRVHNIGSEGVVARRCETFVASKTLEISGAPLFSCSAVCVGKNDFLFKKNIVGNSVPCYNAIIALNKNMFLGAPVLYRKSSFLENL